MNTPGEDIRWRDQGRTLDGDQGRARDEETRGGHEMKRPGEDTRWRDQGRTRDEETRGGHER